MLNSVWTHVHMQHRRNTMNEDTNNYRAFTVLYKTSSAEIWAKSTESAKAKAQSHFKVTHNERNNIRIIKEFDALMLG